jgi:ribose transport system substrate-binding protein
MFTILHNNHGRRLTAAFLAASALVAAVHGGTTVTASTVPPGSEASASSADVDTAALVEQYSTPATEIVQTEPLSQPPDPLKVAFIVCADPSCVVLDGFLEEAVTALGWEYTSINAPATDFGSAVQQAIDTQPDFIAGTGTDAAAFQPQYDAMREAGIPYFTCYATDVPAGEDNNLFANCYDSSAAAVYSDVLASWIIDHSGGSANTLIVSLPAFPILEAQADSASAAFAARCPDCGVDTLDLTIDDLAGGTAPTAIISFLQSNPDINYIYLTYNGFEPGLAEALDSAGLGDSVQITGTQAQQPQLQAIIDGRSAVWTALPQEYAMWSLADQMARVANGEWTSENERTNAVPPFFLIDDAETAESYIDLDNGWPGPDGFKDQFKALWGV